MTQTLTPAARRPPWPAPCLPPVSLGACPAEALRHGDRDADVKELQRALRALGYDQSIDGRFDRTTLECVRSFQATHGLTRDGIVGEQTWCMLQRLVSEVMPHG